MSWMRGPMTRAELKRALRAWDAPRANGLPSAFVERHA